MTLTYLERLPSIEAEIAERWLVRGAPAAAPHVVAVIANDDADWVAEVERATTPWLGFRHRAIGSLRGVTRLAGRLICDVDDDRGPSLLAAAAKLPPEERVPWAIANVAAIADGLRAMTRYQAGFVHRRLIPPAMVVGADGTLRLRAPIAHVSCGPRRPYMGAGTISPGIGWLSPEQLRGVPVPPASDVYQLASTLYAAISARNPHPGEAVFEQMSRILRGDPPDPLPEAPPEVAAVVMRGLAVSLGERYPDVAAFTRALQMSAPWPEPGPGTARLAAWWASAPPPDPGSLDLFGGRCKRHWEELIATPRDDVRHCRSCDQPVVQVRSLAGIVPLAGRRCFELTDA